MKIIKFILSSFFLLSTQNSFSQTDRHGNPVFNSKTIGEENFKNYSITSGYYTIEDNISDNKSSVFVSERPKDADYIKFACGLPSYFFIIHQKGEMKYMLSLFPAGYNNFVSSTYLVIIPINGKSFEVKSQVPGEISEMRAEELFKLKLDTGTQLIHDSEGKVLRFAGADYKIQPYSAVKVEVENIASGLMKSKEKNKTEDLYKYIQKEAIGGKLDFGKDLEDTKLYIYKNIAYSKPEYALVLWGAAMKKLKIDSADEAISLWEDIHEETLIDSDRRAVENGFD